MQRLRFGVVSEQRQEVPLDAHRPLQADLASMLRQDLEKRVDVEPAEAWKLGVFGVLDQRFECLRDGRGVLDRRPLLTGVKGEEIERRGTTVDLDQTPTNRRLIATAFWKSCPKPT